MEKKPKTVTMHVNLPETLLKRFDLAYPSCRKRFTQLCFERALKDKVFFDKVFFGDVLLSHGQDLDI